MPKKFQGINSKSADAKARKASAAAAEQEKKKRDAENALWVDEDKHANRKQERKAAQEKKRLETLQKKKDLESLYKADEEAALSKKKAAAAAKAAPAKLTRAQIEAMKAREEEQRAERAKEEELAKKKITVPEDVMEENVNRAIAERVAKGEVEARSVEEALAALKVPGEMEKHPEKRVRASYKKYEEHYLPILKAENPSLRQSQLRQMLKKEWQKSPENPLNQQHAAYNTK